MIIESNTVRVWKLQSLFSFAPTSLCFTISLLSSPLSVQFSSFIPFPLIAPIDICYARFCPRTRNPLLVKCPLKMELIFESSSLLGQNRKHVNFLSQKSGNSRNSTFSTVSDVYSAVPEIFTTSVSFAHLSFSGGMNSPISGGK